MYAVHRLYVGANNDTGIVEKDKLCAVLDKHFDGYTISDSVGRWKGQNEASCIVDIATDDKALVDSVLSELCSVLKQQAIGLVVLPKMSFTLA